MSLKIFILPTILALCLTSNGWALEDEAVTAPLSKRMAEPWPENDTEFLEPIDWQVAPDKIIHQRSPGQASATQKHFTGDFSVPADQTVLTRTFPRFDEQLGELDPFFRDTSLTLNIRSAFFRIETQPTNLESAWALGGSLVYKSGWWQDFLGIGLGYYTSSGLYKPYNQEGTKLLKTEPGNGSQHSQNVLGQAYAEFKYDIYRVKAYRQALDTPFINEHFDRMLPQLFEAYVIGTKTLQYDEKGGLDLTYNKEYPLSFLAGYVAEELDRGSTTFVPMSSVASRNTTSINRGVGFGGLQFTPFKHWSVDLWEYHGVDMFNTMYLENDFDFYLDADEKWAIKLAIQLADQRTVGDDILGEWSTRMFGVFLGTSYEGLSVSFRYNQVFDGTGTNTSGAPISQGFISPWGRYPGFTKSTVRDYNGADSSMYGLFASYDFSYLTSELKGLEFATSYVFEQRDKTGIASAPNQNEFDVILKYSPDFVKGLSFDVRGSWISAYDSPGASAPAVNDYRFIVNYSIPLL